LINSTEDIADIKTGYVKYMDKFGLSAFLGVPVVCQNSVIGVLSLFRSRKNESYSIEDQALMQNVANKVSLALSNHKLFIEKLNEIEERKIAQDALASQQQLLQSVLETIPVGVWIIDKDKNKILTNVAARKMWSGFGHSELNAPEEYKSWPAEASGECVELYSWASENALNGEISLNDEILIQCFDGSYKTILNSAVPIIKSNGLIQGAIIVNVDITDRKSYEVKLQQTLIELERSNRELEQFAYIASHDLQEPLRMVSSYTQLLEKQYKEKLDNRAVEYISFAVEGAKRMQSLIIDLLKYARVTTRAQAFEPVDCNLVLKEAISDLKMAIDESCADIIYDNLPEVNADPTQIRQLLQNLIGNAIKFHSSKKPLIKISARFQKNEWIFSVEDNGIGIDQRHYERIFMLFQRLHERDKYTGTGIGLAVCKKIVERHGGRIWPESQLNVGTKMLFSIPA
jgi:PAS domain S-box-containing protein